MKLSKATLAFLAKAETFASEITARTYVSDGVVLIADPWWQVSVADYGATLEESACVEARFLRAMRGGKAGELTMGEHPTLNVDGAVFRALQRVKEASPKMATMAQHWRIEDVATFARSLAECIKNASKDERRPYMNAVYMDGGEFLSTNGNQLAVRFNGVDASAALPLSLAKRWAAMLSAFGKSHGAWYVGLTPGGAEGEPGQVALSFRHFGQEARVMGQEVRKGGSAFGPHTIRNLLAKQISHEHGCMLTGDVADFAGMFDAVAIYSNGEVLGWMKDDAHNNNGQSGLLPRGEKPLAVFSGPLLKNILPPGKRGETPRRWVRFSTPMKGDGAGQFCDITLNDNVLMCWQEDASKMPRLPDDAYEGQAAATEQAA